MKRIEFMKYLLMFAMMLVSISGMAQNGKKTENVTNPIVGSWWYEQTWTLELSLTADAKKGNNTQRQNDVCHGALTVYEEFEFYMTLSLKLKQKVSDMEAVYTATGTNAYNKPVKGTIRIKKVGKRVVLTGTNSAGKKWPFSGLTLEVSQ